VATTAVAQAENIGTFPNRPIDRKAILSCWYQQSHHLPEGLRDFL
jgi:hypothetical protein